jgi:hypothetical protein
MKTLILHFPLDGKEKVISFDEDEYKKKNNCSLIKKEIHVFEKEIIITYEMGVRFAVSAG